MVMQSPYHVNANALPPACAILPQAQMETAYQPTTSR